MPANLEPPIEQVFTLPKTDALLGNTGEPTTVTIVQALQGAADVRASLWAEFTRSYDEEGGVEVKQRVSPAVVRRTEVFLALKACNLTHQGKPLFEFPLKENKFIDAWNLLPPAVADEIHEKVLVVNVPWSGEVGEDD